MCSGVNWQYLQEFFGIEKLTCQYQGIQKPVDVRRDARLWELAGKLTPEKKFKEYNYAVLDFTMEICRPRNPACEDCPVSRYCVEYNSSSSLTTNLPDNVAAID
jgi:adenine-specific DNA glycosylase